MAINLFDFAGHCVGVVGSFLVLLAGAVLIDWVLRVCERKIKTTRSLLRILHLSAQALVLSDIVFIAIDVWTALGPQLMKAAGAA